jgi:hypothetical protein
MIVLVLFFSLKQFVENGMALFICLAAGSGKLDVDGWVLGTYEVVGCPCSAGTRHAAKVTSPKKGRAHTRPGDATQLGI